MDLLQNDPDALFDVPTQLRPDTVLPYAEARDFLGDEGLDRLEERLRELCRFIGNLRYKFIVVLFDN